MVTWQLKLANDKCQHNRISLSTALPSTDFFISNSKLPTVSSVRDLGVIVDNLDRVYVSDLDYSGVKVIKSVAKSDHMAIVAYIYTGEMKTAVCKTRRVCTFRKHTAAQHARFLARGTSPVHVVDQNGDPQEEFDKFYSALLQLMDEYYPERSVTITSGDPAYVTPAVKHMLAQKK